MNLRANKLLGGLLAASIFALAACSDVDAGNVVSDNFVAMADSASLKISHTVVKKKTQSVSNGGDAASLSSVSSSSSSSADVTVSTHESFLYSGYDFNYVNGSESYLGFAMSYQSATHFFLVDLTDSTGSLFSAETGIESYRQRTLAQAAADYSIVSAAYDNCKVYAGKSAADVGALSLSFTFADIGSTVGYTLIKRTETASGHLDEYTYFTMDRSVSDPSEYVFTDYIYRTVTTPNQGGSVIYSTTEYSIETVSAYPDLNMSAQTLKTYKISLSGIDLASVSSGSLQQPNN